MRKIFYFVSLMLMGAMMATSCSKTKSYSELLKEEKDAIKKFIRDSSLVIVDEFPAKFGEKVYYKYQRYNDADVAEVYLHVVDFGDTTQMAKDGSMIYVRMTDVYNIKDNTIFFRNNIFPEGSKPYQFTYSDPYTTSDGGCLGWALPLEKIGKGAVVKMIIGSKSGLPDQQKTVVPLYYPKLEYTQIQ